MAWSNVVNDATAAGLLAADKPVLLGQNLLRSAPVMKWVAAGGTGADQSAGLTWPGMVAAGFVHSQSKPNAPGATWTFYVDLGAELPFDSVVLVGQALGAASALAVDIADNAAFSTRLQNIASATVAATARRKAFLKLGGGNGSKYTARYVRVNCSGGNFVPQLAEVFVGARRQLKALPDDPWDPDAKRSLGEQQETDTGIRSRNIRGRGQRLVDAHLTAYEEPYRSDLVAFFHSDIADGTQPFVWIDKPGTAPDDAYVMTLDEPKLSYPYGGPFKREMDLVATEQGPLFRSQEV